MQDQVDHRFLAGVRFVSAATSLPVAGRIDLDIPGLEFVRSRRGIYAVRKATGFDAHTRTFDSQPPGAEQTFSGTAIDRSGLFLARRVELTLPRDANLGNVETDGSLFRPVDVPLYLAPQATISSSWSLFRALILDADTGNPLPGALVRISSSADGVGVAWGMSQLDFYPQNPSRQNPAAGELLVAMPDIPITTWGAGEGEVVLSEVPVEIEVRYDPAAFTDDIPDPNALAATGALVTNPTEFNMASGRTRYAGDIEVNVPP